MEASCIHKRSLNRCARCLPKAQWPKDHEACRCKKLVPKGSVPCFDCYQFELEAALPGGFLDRSQLTFYKVQGMFG